MLEIRLPRVLQSVQETLRRQDAARELQRRQDAARQLRLQALRDEVEFIKSTPLIPVMQRAASLLRLGFKDVWLVMRKPEDILEAHEAYHNEVRLGVHLYWRNNQTTLNETQVFATRNEKGEITGFNYNYYRPYGRGGFNSDLSREEISEAVDQAVINPLDSKGWHFGTQIRIPKHK